MDANKIETMKALALAVKKASNLDDGAAAVFEFSDAVTADAVLELIAEVDRLRAEKAQAMQDSFALAWDQALSDAAFYVASRCADGEHYAEAIMELVAPKLTIADSGSAPAAGTVKKDAARLADGYQGSTMVSDFHGPKITMRYSTTAQADAAHEVIASIVDPAMAHTKGKDAA